MEGMENLENLRLQVNQKGEEEDFIRVIEAAGAALLPLPPQKRTLSCFFLLHIFYHKISH